MVDDIRATKKTWKSNTAAEMTRKPPTQNPTVSPLDRVLVMMLLKLRGRKKYSLQPNERTKYI